MQTPPPNPPTGPNPSILSNAQGLLEEFGRRVESAFTNLANEVTTLDRQFATFGTQVAGVMVRHKWLSEDYVRKPQSLFHLLLD
jgi:hypothetical protein